MLVSTMQSYAGQICCLFAELSQGQLTHPLEPAVQSCPDDSRIHGHTDAPQWAQNCGPKVTQISAELSLNYGSAWGELQPTPHFLHRQWRMLLVKQPRPNSSFPLILPDAALQNFNSIGAPTSNLLFLAIFFSFFLPTLLSGGPEEQDFWGYKSQFGWELLGAAKAVLIWWYISDLQIDICILKICLWNFCNSKMGTGPKCLVRHDNYS